MMKIYTPKEWLSVFRGCPSLIIDDKGLIWAGDEYYKILFGEPSGKIDFEKGYIYGEDYAKLMATPIGILEKVNDLIKVYDYQKGRFSAPILYIQNDKIYTPEQWTSIFDIPGGYIEKDLSSGGKSGVGSSSGGKSGAGSSSAEETDSGHTPMSGFVFAELGVVIVVLILAVGSIQSMMKSRPGMLAYIISVFLIAILVGRHNRGHNPFLTSLASLRAGRSHAQVALCKKNAVFWAVLCCVIPFVCGIWMVMDCGTWAFVIFLIPMLILGWASYLSFRNAILRGDLKCWPFTQVSSP